MIGLIQHSISRKLMLVVVATTLLALLAYGITLLIYDIGAYNAARARDLATQANIIAEVSAPALEFNDVTAAEENLSLLRTRQDIVQGAIYTADGNLFAAFSRTKGTWRDFFAMPLVPGDYVVDEGRITVARRITRAGTVLGTVYLQADYDIRERVLGYAKILLWIMAASLALATLISIWLQRSFTKPIFAVTNVARDVMFTRDYSLRAKKFSQDEIGVLADAFNDMLSQVEERTHALEESNQFLAHEMAERQAAETALRQADRRKDEFLATLAHELRNPLAPMVNSLKILSMRQDPASRQKAQDIMERQMKQMVRLVDDLLDVSRITTGKLTVNKGRIDIQAVMQAALESSIAVIEGFHHTLETQVPEESIYLDADAVRLAQVFSNLLNNAAKYTNPGGCIQFKAYLEEGELVVEVSDNGIGIAGGMLNQIFDMFTQVDDSLERTHAGLGVGLALSRRLVELHGGTLEARSKGENRGSTFTVRLPGAVTSDARGDTGQFIIPPKEQECRILLVDDNVDFVTTTATLLSTLGHDVRTAHSGGEALEVAKEFKFDAAFLDIGMPGLNGYDLAQRLRAMPESADAILVAVTGWGQQKDREKSRAAGFDHHLVKPVELVQILEVLQLRNNLNGIRGSGKPT